MCFKTILKGALVGGVILFVASFLSWMAIPWHDIKTFNNEREVSSVISRNVSTSGMYVLPQCCTSTVKNPPLITAIVNVERNGEMNQSMLVYSFLIQFVAAGILTALLLTTKGLSFLQKALFAAAAGFFVAWNTSLPDWNWIGLPASYVAVDIAHYTLAWFLTGLGIAFVIQRCEKKHR